MGTIATYTCPIYLTTDDFLTGKSFISFFTSPVKKTSIFFYYFLVQYSQCIWDTDTDEMAWYPSDIEECTRCLLYTSDAADE